MKKDLHCQNKTMVGLKFHIPYPNVSGVIICQNKTMVGLKYEEVARARIEEGLLE